MAFGKKLFHGATLAFTAFWLMATSRRPEPTVECFVPLESRSLEIKLGAPVAPAPGAGPSCAGLDGLRDGARLTVELDRSVDPPKVGAGDRVCWSYRPVKLSGATGIAGVNDEEPDRFQPTALFQAYGPLQRPGHACEHLYRLSLYVDAPFSPGMRADPLRAGAPERWRVRRVIDVSPSSPCFSKVPRDTCDDVFEVKRIDPAR